MRVNRSRFKQYTIEWRIDVTATSARNAAECALAVQRDPESLATVFLVFPQDGSEVVIDLEEEGIEEDNNA